MTWLTGWRLRAVRSRWGWVSMDPLLERWTDDARTGRAEANERSGCADGTSGFVTGAVRPRPPDYPYRHEPRLPGRRGLRLTLRPPRAARLLRRAGQLSDRLGS